VQIVRFRADGKTRYGALEGGAIAEYSGTPFTLFKRARKRYPARQVVLLAPVLPSKIIAIGLNYRDHLAALRLPVPEEPVMFLKPVSALAGPDDPIVYPAQSTCVDYEAELAVVIRRRCRDVPVARAREYVLGYTCLNDVTARDLREHDGQWTRAKGFDTFCPIGPCIATNLDPGALTVESFLNGTARQSASTQEMVFSVEEIVASVSTVMTLLPGDVITTGTPPGTGPMQPGDHVEVRIDGIGSLRNTVVKL
jgi:2-keto-4-pentenoate hydratase/2-oxohepta-3-ene-1,7-dioic acid hydratase in catechol pathway